MLSNRKNIKVHKPRRTKQRIPWADIAKKLLFWFFVLAFLAVGVWTVIFSPVMQVDQINIANNRIDKQEIASIIQADISGMVASVIPRDNLLLIPSRKIQDDLKQQFKLIRNVTVKRVFPKAILVEIEERSSVLVWCQTGDCYLVDETGTAFYQLKPTDPELQDESLVKIEDKSQTEVVLGSKIMEQNSVQYFLALPQKLQQLSIPVERQFSTPSIMANEIRVRTNDGWEIILNVEEPLDKQLETLKQVLDEKVGQAQMGQLEYVDLRLKGRVVYKLKNTEPTENEESSETAGEPTLQEPAPAKKDEKKPHKNT